MVDMAGLRACEVHLDRRDGVSVRGNAVDAGFSVCDRRRMSWGAPDLCWQFWVGDEPPDDLPTPWASAIRAVTRDLGCRRHGRRIGFDNVMWKIASDNGSVCVGFALGGDADVNAYQRCNSFRLDTTVEQTTVWLADDVQSELAGYEFVQRPIAGTLVLVPLIIDKHATWVDPKTDAVIAPVGELCRAASPLLATGES